MELLRGVLGGKGYLYEQKGLRDSYSIKAHPSIGDDSSQRLGPWST